MKSLHRRAVTRNALGKHRAALCDLQTAAEIDPTSKEVGDSFVLCDVDAGRGTSGIPASRDLET